MNPPFNPNYRCKVLEKFGKTEEDMVIYLQILKDWYLKEQHLPKLTFDKATERKFERILVSSKFRVEKAKSVIDARYSVRNAFPEVFTNWDLSDPVFQKHLQTGTMIISPKLTEDLCRVTIIRQQKSNPDDFEPWMALKSAIMYLEFRATNDISYGEQYIYDMTNVRFGHAVKWTPSILKAVYDILREAYATKISGMNFWNLPPQLTFLISSMKLILKPKMFERIHVHKNLESLHKIIPKEVLPADFGGELPTYDEIYAQDLQLFLAARDTLMNEIAFRSDEKKRIGPINNKFCESLHGTFRQLSVD